MTLLTYIFLVALGAGAIDFALTRYVRLQESVYRIALLVIWFLFVIRYYYGADIYNYVPWYEKLQPAMVYLQHPELYEFEHGFVIFCAILKNWGLSYYWMTAIVTTMFFITVAIFLRKVKRHKAMILMIAVIFDYNLIFAAHRQCMAVCTFIFMMMLLDNRRYGWALLMAWLTVVLHKSGIFVVGLTWMYYLVHYHRLEKWMFITLFGLICFMLVVPITSFSTAFLNHLPLPEPIIRSLNEHASLGRQIQVIWAVYVVLLISFEYYLQHRDAALHRGTEAVVVIGVCFVVLFYQYYYFLNRIRSFFLLPAVVYLFQTIQEAEDSEQKLIYAQTLLKDLCSVFMFAYLGLTTWKFENNARQLHSNIYAPSTVFDLRYESPKDIRARQLHTALMWWWYDYMKDEKNKVNAGS